MNRRFIEHRSHLLYSKFPNLSRRGKIEVEGEEDFVLFFTYPSRNEGWKKGLPLWLRLSSFRIAKTKMEKRFISLTSIVERERRKVFLLSFRLRLNEWNSLSHLRFFQKLGNKSSVNEKDFTLVSSSYFCYSYWNNPSNYNWSIYEINQLPLSVYITGVNQ